MNVRRGGGLGSLATGASLAVWAICELTRLVGVIPKAIHKPCSILGPLRQGNRDDSPTRRSNSTLRTALRASTVARIALGVTTRIVVGRVTTRVTYTSFQGSPIPVAPCCSDVGVTSGRLFERVSSSSVCGETRLSYFQ